ncbi:hypothetical protein PILCRDRAFT_809858 [Piloderma croceum F 1598]|uniref:Uncharacterized protein n=1 Tax=Piloderma croceum (strain F 1598) TaxID=765440 RepID=A0A0C3G6I1_PILCF|nr:hypothetical protein PILCRDRAFT_809858 [Piloderma croceum F 1598]
MLLDAVELNGLSKGHLPADRLNTPISPMCTRGAISVSMVGSAEQTSKVQWSI